MVSLGDTAISLHILQPMPKFQFLGGGEGLLFWKSKTQSAMICLNFKFFLGGGGRAVLNQIPEQDVLRNLSTNFALPLSGSLCITDSLSHTMYVETNEGPDIIMHQLKSSYNSPFIDSYSHPSHTCFAMISSNEDAVKLTRVPRSIVSNEIHQISSSQAFHSTSLLSIR